MEAAEGTARQGHKRMSEAQTGKILKLTDFVGSPKASRQGPKGREDGHKHNTKTTGGLRPRLNPARPSGAEKPVGLSKIPPDWLAEFEAASRRPLATRMRYAFIHTYKPAMDDAPFRAFNSTAEYRRWCEENLPDWLGCGRI